MVAEDLQNHLIFNSLQSQGWESWLLGVKLPNFKLHYWSWSLEECWISISPGEKSEAALFKPLQLHNILFLVDRSEPSCAKFNITLKHSSSLQDSPKIYKISKFISASLMPQSSIANSHQLMHTVYTIYITWDILAGGSGIAAFHSTLSNLWVIFDQSLLNPTLIWHFAFGYNSAEKSCSVRNSWWSYLSHKVLLT